MPHLALIAMPWSQLDRPSAAIAALAPYVRRERPAWTVSCHSEYLHLAVAIGKPLYETISDAAYRLGDPLYAALVYPEKRAGLGALVEQWLAYLEREGNVKPADRAVVDVVDRLPEMLAAHIDDAVARLPADVTAVGLTTCFGQLFANLALARAIRRRFPDAKVVLGGSTVSSRVGPSILREYPFLDAVIQGEGERPLATWLADVEQRVESRASAGILARAGGVAPARPAEMVEMERLDDTPLPDYEEFDAAASSFDVDWVLPVEGSRGCWWDRTKRTNDPRQTCYFCNLNMQWAGYREKSVRRIVDEARHLSERHGRLRLYFLDNIIRHRGVVDLAEGLKSLGKDFEIFYEARANIHPYELLVLWEAGLRYTQFGVEALSNDLLRRMNKGTTVIQNLSVMRLCTELGIDNQANLIIHFPGSTAEEVAETRETILSTALSFTPLNLAVFHLGVDSTLDTLRDEFGIVDVRNEDFYDHVIPGDVLARLSLSNMSYAERTPSADWSSVRETVEAWRDLHRRVGEPLLRYWDGGGFLVIEDRRGEEFSTGTLRGLERELYLHCMEPRSKVQILRRFVKRGDGPREREVTAALEAFVDDGIMFVERGEASTKYLSLATAAHVGSAVRRIRGAWEEEQAQRRESRPRARLDVIS